MLLKIVKTKKFKYINETVSNDSDDNDIDHEEEIE